ncbi:MAG: PilZ domain-containing protein [Planctomycetes bacterium]|nr:PilZ domain-containing protein [Planctomycetota bacterium]
MQFDPRANVTNLTDSSNGRRRFGRVPLEAVQSDLGKVLELSANGMRVKARKLPKGTFTVRIYGLGMELEVKGHVVWQRRSGVMSRIAGVEFLEVSPTVSRQLTTLGMNNRDQRTME